MPAKGAPDTIVTMMPFLTFSGNGNGVEVEKALQSTDLVVDNRVGNEGNNALRRSSVRGQFERIWGHKRKGRTPLWTPAERSETFLPPWYCGC